MQETWVQPLGQEDALEEERQPTPVFLPGNPMDREDLSRLQFMGSQRVRCDLVTEHACTHNNCCFVLQMKKV